MKKILWLSHLVPYPPKGGVLQRAFHLLRETARHHEVHLLAFEQADLFDIHFQSREDAIAESEAGLSFCRSIEYIRIPCDVVPLGKEMLAGASVLTRNPYTINWLVSGAFSRAVRRAWRQTEFDIVHFDTISLAPYLKQIGTTPATLDHHNVESQMMLRRAELEKRWPKRWYFRLEGRKLERYERAHCARFASNLMCSDLDRERLETICGNVNTHVVPNGVDTEYFSPERRSSTEKLLVFAGRLSAYTNAEAARFIATEIWPAVVSRMPDATMDLVGYGPPSEVLALAESDERFAAPGFVDDVRTYIDRAMIYVCPIFDGGGTKLKILDAMAMGKPIVATRVACEGIDLVDGVSVLFAESGAEFVDAIERLRGNEALRSQLAANARELAVDRYSYASIGRDLARLFDSIAN